MVKAENEAGCMVINESDFDSSIHEPMPGQSIEKTESAWTNTPDGEYVNLGDMSKEQLQALAKKHGVEVHHKSGVDKLIEAIQAAFAAK